MQHHKNLLTFGELSELLELAGKGWTINKLTAHFRITNSWFKRMLDRDSLFSEKFNAARKIACEANLDDLQEQIENASDPLELNKAKLLSENAKWIASKRNREVYGDKVDVNATMQLDLGDVLKAANARIATGNQLPANKLDQRTKDIEFIEYDDSVSETLAAPTQRELDEL